MPADEVELSDLHPGVPEFVAPTSAATEWTLEKCRTALEAIQAGGAPGTATAAKQDTQITAEQAILAKIIAAPATEAKQDSLITANHTDLAAILAKIIAAPATSAKQDTQITAEQAILAKIIAAPATEAKQDSLITANHTDLAAILAKIIAAPATEAKQDSLITANHTDLAAILAKIIAAPATSAKQDTQITAEQAILAKIIAAPATEAKQDSLITANHTDLAAILAKIIAAPATEVTVAAVLAKLTAGISDAGAAWTSVFGVAGARFTSANASAAVASVTDAPTSGQKLVITDLEISVDTAMRVDVKEETTGTVLASAYLAANSTVNLVTRSKRKLATANKKLQIQTSVAGNISVGAFYYSEA